MFQINRRLIVVQTFIISPPLGLGDLLFFPDVRPFVRLSVCGLKILNKNRILTSIKGCKVAKLRKITFCNPKVDLVKDNVNAKFGLS